MIPCNGAAKYLLRTQSSSGLQDSFLELYRQLVHSTSSILSESQRHPKSALTSLMNFCVTFPWKQASISGSGVTSTTFKRAHAWQSFTDGFVIPLELCTLWARGFDAEMKPWGSSADGKQHTICLLCAYLLQ